ATGPPNDSLPRMPNARRPRPCSDPLAPFPARQPTVDGHVRIRRSTAPRPANRRPTECWSPQCPIPQYHRSPVLSCPLIHLSLRRLTAPRTLTHPVRGRRATGIDADPGYPPEPRSTPRHAQPYRRVARTYSAHRVSL